jgi:hypothetical protein
MSHILQLEELPFLYCIKVRASSGCHILLKLVLCKEGDKADSHCPVSESWKQVRCMNEFRCQTELRCVNLLNNSRVNGKVHEFGSRATFLENL